MESATLVLQIRGEGEERYRIENARYNLYLAQEEYAYEGEVEEEELWEFTLKFSTSEALLRVPELAEVINARPHVEATAVLRPDQCDLQPGTVIEQPEGYDYDRDEHLSNIYYFNHNPVEALQVTILDMGPDWIEARIRGKAIINAYGDPDPDGELSIERVRLQLDPELRRSFS
ncbi:MAG: hypothetical protein H6581_11750 [Bacteroidia bacterium]|nr:hypothetical protein [Bacteroidia bacterium]